jgi:hypothetical protein
MRPRRVGMGVCLVLAVAVGAAACTAVAWGAGLSPAAPTVSAPLTGSVTADGTAWAVVLMGRNDGEHDSFWQLFRLDPVTGRWSLSTPKGVADNGGLSVAVGPTGGDLLVGFETSQALGFSPLALTTDDGTSWTQGGLTEPIAATPSSMALGPGDSAAAVVEGARPALLSRSGSLTDWSTSVSLRGMKALAAAGACAVGSLTAVDVDAVGEVLAGVSCRRAGVPPVLVDAGGRWHLADLPVPHALAGVPLRVLRLGPVGSTVGGLLAGAHGPRVSVLATWAPDATGAWAVSPPLALGSSAVVASGTGAGTAQFVISRDGSGLRAEVVGGPGQTWHALPAPPVGAATVAFSPSGAVDALAVHQATLTVWQLGADGRSWTDIQSVEVPIAYGSSD